MPYDFARPLNIIALELVSGLAMVQADLAKPIVYFTSAAVSVIEPNIGTTVLTLTARRSTLVGTLSVLGLFVPGTAVAADFPDGLPGNKTWDFPAGSDTATVDIVIRGDFDFEGDETFGFDLQPGATYRLGSPSSVTGTILNNDSEIPPATFTMQQLAMPNRVYQRESFNDGGPGKGKGRIPVTLNVTGAGEIYARCRSTAAGNPVVQAPWLAVANAAVANGPVDIQGVEARLERVYLDTAGSADGPWQLGTVPVGVGRINFMTGQSLQVRNFLKTEDTTTIAQAGVTVTQAGAVYGSGETETAGAWRVPSDAGPVTSAAAAELINLQSALFGVQIGLVFVSVGNTSLTTWQPGTENSNSAISTLNAIGNRIEAHWQYQGHSDAGRGYRDYFNLLKTWMGTVAANTVGRAPARYFTAIPNINREDIFGPEIVRSLVRGVAEDYAKLTGGTYLPMNDIAMQRGEGVHALQTGAIRQVQHYHRATQAELGLTGDKGGTYGAITVSGSTITVPVTLPAGATSLVSVGDPKSRFAIRDRGKSDPLAIASLAVNANSLVITMASPLPSNRVEVSPFQMAGGDDGSANMIYANLNEGVGTNPVGRQLHTPARPLLSRPKVPLDVTGVTFGAGKFGQGRSGGNITIPQGTMPSVYGGMSIETWVTPTLLAGGLQVILSLPDILYIKQDGATMGVGDGDSIPIELGKSYHVAIVFDPGGNFKGAFINGALINYGRIASSLDKPIFVGHLNGQYGYTRGVIDEVAMFYAPYKYVDPGFALPTAPYVGNEDGLLHLWHLNGDGADSCSLNA